MDPKYVKESSTVFSHLMSPQDANIAGNVHGGVIMKHIDNAAGVVAVRHSRSNAVTASIDRLDFYNPVFIGNILTIKASINLVGKSSAEIGVRAEAEDVLSGEVRHVASAYLTFVALDGQAQPQKMPPVVYETEDEKRRNRMAIIRKENRIAEKQREKSCIQNPGSC